MWNPIKAYQENRAAKDAEYDRQRQQEAEARGWTVYRWFTLDTEEQVLAQESGE